MDSYFANYLMQTLETARLLGAEAIVTGISGEAAQSLVALGLDLRHPRTAGDLTSGIEAAERLLGPQWGTP
jgi:rsbT co-antagonist protein RsbR